MRPRDKRRSAFDLNYEENGKMVAKPGTRDLYYAPFINAESYRECCYECQYAREERVSDITIGDCDSYRLYSGLEKNNIISSILINTEKENISGMNVAICLHSPKWTIKKNVFLIIS